MDPTLLAVSKQFTAEPGSIPSNAAPPRVGHAQERVLPNSSRGPMPLTKSKYIVKENPDLVMWEREVRKFLRQLSPAHEHRVSASMVYEWATGTTVAELMSSHGNTSDLRKINQILRFYFGKPYQTYIVGHKVPKAYKVKQGTYITRRRPMTLALYVEFMEGTLNDTLDP